MNLHSIVSSVKDEALIKRRRNQIVAGAMVLFKQKGFHRTTTREIAKQSGFSIGTLYEYIRAKEDVLYLVYEAINEHVHDRLLEIIDEEEPSIDTLKKIVDQYYRLMDDMQDEVTILYQEVKSLETNVKDTVLEQEREKVLLFKQAVQACLPQPVDDRKIELLANNIFVQGHMWGFRRWVLYRNFTLDDYIDMQIELLFQSLQLKV
ncbi:MAG TPA: TetR/AcrR family transcriptional regulator [Pseudogracilibacillus sp.]|nr:TetR/AcrR family transcriptional regulator [Pseudogracilibacillus sp.]